MTEHDFAQKLQTYLQDGPLVVLGSGASVPYGLPTMQDLGDAVLQDSVVKADEEYEQLAKNIRGGNFEQALNESSLSAETHERIKELIWELVNRADRAFFQNNDLRASMPLSQLFKKLVSTATKKCTVVTTNYDRLAEYAAGYAGCLCSTGFVGELIKHFDIDYSSTFPRKLIEQRGLVSILKVHGSLDWFETREGHVAYPSCAERLEGHVPLIIPPSMDKYRCSAREPFRDIINKSDAAFKEAKCYLCLGYGFNDEHIEPKLLDQARHNKPIVVVAKNLTERCRDIFLQSKSIPQFILIEEGDAQNTRVYMSSSSKEGFTQIPIEGARWTLDELLKTWF